MFLLITSASISFADERRELGGTAMLRTPSRKSAKKPASNSLELLGLVQVCKLQAVKDEKYCKISKVIPLSQKLLPDDARGCSGYRCYPKQIECTGLAQTAIFVGFFIQQGRWVESIRAGGRKDADVV